MSKSKKTTSPTHPPESPSAWQELSSSSSGIWFSLLSARMWIWCLGLLLAWFLGTYVVSWWSEGLFQSRNHTWMIWMDRWFLGVLAFLLLARLVEQYFLLAGHPTLPLPSTHNTRHYRLATSASYTTDDLLKTLSLSQHTLSRRAGSLLWIEQGTLHAWGRWFVLLALFLMITSLLLAPHWPTLHLGTRVALLSAPWLFVGLLLQWGPSHRVVAIWPDDHSIAMWGYSDTGWNDLSHDIAALQTQISSTTSQKPSASTQTQS